MSCSPVVKQTRSGKVWTVPQISNSEIIITKKKKSKSNLTEVENQKPLFSE